MKKRVVSMLLAVVMMLGMFPGTALAAGSVEEALGEVNIYNGEQKLSYLSINGRVRISAHCLRREQYSVFILRRCNIPCTGRLRHNRHPMPQRRTRREGRN